MDGEIVALALAVVTGGVALAKRVARRTVEQAEAYVTEVLAQRDSWREAADRLRDERDAARAGVERLRAENHQLELELVRTVQALERASDDRARPDPPPDA